jgi:hypothetical protein
MHNHDTTSGCLNCATPVAQMYCPNCGQKSTTHRYSIKHFIEHDFIHGVWHVDKGILFTVKELFTRPGHGVRDYIQGKRANYFSFVTLILLIITLSTLLAPYVHIKMTDLIPLKTRINMNSFEKFVSTYPKIVVILVIPFTSCISFLWFRKTRLNFSEHLVANSYKAAAELIIGLAFSLLIVFYTDIKVLSIIYLAVITPLIIIYGIVYYYQLFSGYDYSKKALLTRSILAVFSIFLVQGIIGAIWGAVELSQRTAG